MRSFAVTGCWAGVPADRVVHLRGAGESAVDLALRVQPADGPAIVTYLPEHPSSVPETVTALLDQLDTLALRLWSGPVGAGSVSTGPAAEPGAGHFGPFLADLAERAGTGSRRGQPFTAEVRAAGAGVQPVRLAVAAHDHGPARGGDLTEHVGILLGRPRFVHAARFLEYGRYGILSPSSV